MKERYEPKYFYTKEGGLTHIDECRIKEIKTSSYLS